MVDSSNPKLKTLLIHALAKFQKSLPTFHHHQQQHDHNAHDKHDENVRTNEKITDDAQSPGSAASPVASPLQEEPARKIIKLEPQDN